MKKFILAVFIILASSQTVEAQQSVVAEVKAATEAAGVSTAGVIPTTILAEPLGLTQEMIDNINKIPEVEEILVQTRLILFEHEVAEAQERKEAAEFRAAVTEKWKSFAIFTAKYVAPIVGGIFSGKAIWGGK